MLSPADRYTLKVELRVQELRNLLPGSDVARTVSIAPNLLLNDVQTCLRPRMTRLVVAMSMKQLGGVLDAEKVHDETPAQTSTWCFGILFVVYCTLFIVYCKIEEQ